MFRLPRHSGPRRMSRRSMSRVLGLLFPLLCIITIWRLSSSSSTAAHGPGWKNGNGMKSHSDLNPNTSPFWDLLVEALRKTEPEGDEIKAPKSLERVDFDPRGAGPQLSLNALKLPEKQLRSLKETHKDYVRRIRDLAPKLPFEKKSRGIVITSNKDLFGIAVTAILMIRRVGSKLPIQLFLDSADERQQQICNDSLGDLKVECLSFDDFLPVSNSSGLETPKLERFQFKVFSIIFSKFQDILFLDADAFPIRNPDHLFEVEPFKSHGLVTWPDFWVPTISPLFYEIAEAKMPNITIDSRASESGILLYDKAVHAESLLLAAYYNFHGKYYFQLQSQGAWGSGDKETFLQAALALGKPAWQVQTDAEFVTVDQVHDGSAIWQADPEFDWKKQNNLLTSKSENGTMFAHLNRIKIDTRHLGKLVTDPVIKKDGKLSRIWGSDVDYVAKVAGYDLEKVIWETVTKATCKESLLEECELINNYYDEVFVKAKKDASA